MTRPRLAATALLGLLAALIAHGPASAQQNDISPLPVDPATSPLRCLQQPEAPLEYPAEARRLQLDGTVRVGLAFTAPDRPPEVEVLARFADERFVNAVRERVAAYRLPCQAAARGTVRAVQTFIFRLREPVPVRWSQPVELQDTGRARALRACLRTPDDQLQVNASRFDQKTVGNVLVRMTFTAPDQPPEVQALYASTSGNTQDAILDLTARAIEQGQDEGVVRRGNPLAIARGLLLAAHGYVLSAQTMVDDDVTEEELDAELAHLLTRSLQP